MPAQARERRRPESGFGSIEAIVALALLSMIATGLSSTLTYARRLQSHTAMERHAMHLAVSAVERLRSGETPDAFDDPVGFTTKAFVIPHGAVSTLLEARVEVSWQAEQPRKLVLRTLLMR